MPIIQCPDCGGNVSDRAEACIHCGFPLREFINEQVESAEEKEVQTPEAYHGPVCSRCNSRNIDIVKEGTGTVVTKGKAEVRKKSPVTRAGNNAGRAGMILATGGLWALTPKKSKYKETSKSVAKEKKQKMCHCLDCGHQWKYSLFDRL